jgi:hypothetical protein
MSAYYRQHIKSCTWFSYPIYVNLAILLHINSSISSYVQYWWSCKISFFLLVSFFMILVAFLKASHLSYSPCWYLWCLWHVCGWSSSIGNKIKLGLWPCFIAKNLIGILHDSILDIMFYSLISILCWHVSLWKYIFVMLST